MNKTSLVEHNWILALTIDIHSCSHVTASNMKPMVDSGAAIHVCPNWYGFSPTFLVQRNSCHSRVLGETCWHHLGSKTESYVYRNLKFQVNYEVAPFDAKEFWSCLEFTETVHIVQLPDGHKIPMIRENGTMVLNATLVDRRNMKCDFGCTSCSDCSSSVK